MQSRVPLGPGKFRVVVLVFYNQVLSEFGYTQFVRLVDGMRGRSYYLKEFLVCNVGNGLQK